MAVGHVGPCTSQYVGGWATLVGDRPRALTVRVNGASVGEVTPWLPRPDVAAALGLANARGFFFSLPRRLAQGDRVDVVDPARGPLTGCPIVYEIDRLPTERGFMATRAAIASMFLRGAGLEIGAFTQPTDLPAEVTVEYYDRYPGSELRKFYDETCGRPLIEPDYFGDAQVLEGIPAGKTFDFIIANHVIEHFEDPITFLKSVSAALRRNGRALLIAPNKRHTFDRGRDMTPFAHLVDDHFGGAARNRMPHYLEWAARVDGLSGEAAEQRARKLERDDFSIYFHVWDENAFVGFLTAAIDKFSLPLSLLFAYNAHHEVSVILERL